MQRIQDDVNRNIKCYMSEAGGCCDRDGGARSFGPGHLWAAAWDGLSSCETHQSEPIGWVELLRNPSIKARADGYRDEIGPCPISSFDFGVQAARRKPGIALAVAGGASDFGARTFHRALRDGDGRAPPSGLRADSLHPGYAPTLTCTSASARRIG